MRRRLKLHESGDLYHILYGRANSKPSLLLKGCWLHDAGFRAGDYVDVEVEEGRLVITPRRIDTFDGNGMRHSVEWLAALLAED